MRLTLALFTILAANPALAHVGHLAEVAGHGHWVAAGAIAIALGIAALGSKKGAARKDKTQDSDVPDVPDDDVSDEEEALA